MEHWFRRLFGVAVILSLLRLTENCQLHESGGIGHVEMGLTYGCTMACFGPGGQQVHVLHETGETGVNPFPRNDQMIVMATQMPTGVEMALVLASYQPISWVIQLSPNVNITSVMLISKYPNLTNISILSTHVNSNTFPATVRALYPPISYKLGAKALGIIRLAERQYGLVTSYTATEHARMWRLRATPTENPCISADWTVLRPPPYPHPTLPPIPTELVTETISTAGSLFIGVVLTIVLGFIPLFLCLCCLCFRARRNRHPQGGASAGFSLHPATGAPSGVVLAGVDPIPPDLPPAYELSLRPALPPAPPDYEKVDDDLPPPYSVVVAMKYDCL